MFFSIWFWCIPPHVWNHVSICFPPYAIHRTVHILNIMSPHAALHMVFMELSTWFTCVLHIIQNISTYAFLHMVYMRPSTWFKSCLHMLPSIRCTSHCPHIEYHVSTCCSPHGFHGIVRMHKTMSAYAVVHMVSIVVSTCFQSSLHMLFSTWFYRMCPHASNHISGIRGKPWGHILR